MTDYEKQLNRSLLRLEKAYDKLSKKYTRVVYMAVSIWTVTVIFLPIILGEFCD